MTCLLNMNKSQNQLLSSFHSQVMRLLAIFGLSTNRNDSFPYSFIYLNKWNPNTPIYLKPGNGIPFGWSLRV